MHEVTIKKKVRERDGHCCTECGMTAGEHRDKFGRNLHVHRITPGSEYTVDGCVTLCQECHKKTPGTDGFRFFAGRWRWFHYFGTGSSANASCCEDDDEEFKEQLGCPKEWPPIPEDKLRDYRERTKQRLERYFSKFSPFVYPF